MTQETKHREFWIQRDFNSNVALIRQDGEKWPTDINGNPDSTWERFVEYAALAEAQKEIGELKVHIKSLELVISNRL